MTSLGLTVEWMEEERNPGNCSIRTIVDGQWHAETQDGYIHRGHMPASRTRQATREAGIVG